ncbi:lactonase family protein [Paenibacillus sp. DS2015]|uniref:lactonase family protein n=1 Tax=Paenibacillus sp. DS2015 TaxID=3373917 RepID=UPI003D20EB00
MFVFVGSYAEADHSGVYVYSFDKGTGELSLVDEFTGLKNPTFLNVDPKQHILYAISETQSAEGAKIGEAAAFSIDPTSGVLGLMNRNVNIQSTTCHIQRDPHHPYLIVVSYHGGTVGLLSIENDGRVGALLDVKQHEGHGAHPERQDRPHPHSSFFSPDGKVLFVQDLGLDIIQSYRIEAGKLVESGKTELHAGAGPRHLAFHPNGQYAFVINEVDSTITSFAYDAEAGRLNTIETVPTLPSDFKEENTCAEITVSNDGKFVYGANRGHDSIVVYAFDESTSILTYVEHVHTEGAHPRHFSLTPEGDYMIVANRDTDNIVTFNVDQVSGKLSYTGHSVKVSKPVCVQPYYM